MLLRGGWGLALMALLASCAALPGGQGPWNISEEKRALGVAADDRWCGHMRALRASLDEAGPVPTRDERRAALAGVREEAEALKGGDPFWPFRKSLICDYTDGAAEERAKFDWSTVSEFLAAARAAADAPPPASGAEPLVPVFAYSDEVAARAPISFDLSDPAYCDALKSSGRALGALRADVVDAVSFPGSLRRAPDWFAMIQVAYHRWALEQIEGHQLAPGNADFGGIPFHCRRFRAAWLGSEAFAVKDNLIFLLPERGDPARAGRLEITDAAGGRIVLDDVLAAAQFEAGGANGETVDFYDSDLAAAPGLSGAVARTDSLPPPRTFRILFASGAVSPVEGAEEIAALRAELAGRDPGAPLRVALTGHADCVGPAGYNRGLSRRRARTIAEEIVRPALREAGFFDETLNDPRTFRITGRGESDPAVRGGPRCDAEAANRRVVVTVQ